MEKYAFGVDIGGTYIKIGLFETNGKLIEKWQIPTNKKDRGEYILKDIAKAINDKIATSTFTIADVKGIGVGVPGPVGADGTVYRCVNLGWVL